MSTRTVRGRRRVTAPLSACAVVATHAAAPASVGACILLPEAVKNLGNAALVLECSQTITYRQAQSGSA